MIESEYKIYKTEEYDKFTLLRGNRDITATRKSKIKESINEVGYICNPIIVNQKMEIIDGQGRFSVLKEMKLPIYYIVIPDIGLNECIAMNMSNTRWGYMDFIKSYANKGNPNFMNLQALMNDYRWVGINTLYCACKDFFMVSNLSIKNGTLEISDEDVAKCRQKLEAYKWLAEKDRKKINGGFQILIKCLCFLWDMPEIDNRKLIEKLKENIYNLRKFGDAETCFNALEDIYNFNSKKGHVFIQLLAKQKMYERLREAKVEQGKKAMEKVTFGKHGRFVSKESK